MYFVYCEECKTKECTFKCTKMMMDILEEKGYKFAGCPDKESASEAQEVLFLLNPMRAPYILKDGSHCTADIRMMNEQNDELYLEIKRIPFAFESQKEIGPCKAYERIMFLISEIFDMYDKHADTIRNNYTIKIERGYIPDFDPSTFYEQYNSRPQTLNPDIIQFIDKFVSYIDENVGNWGKFSYKRKSDIEISFIPEIPFREREDSSSVVRGNADFVPDAELKDILLCDLIMKSQGFYFEIPPNETGSVDLQKYVNLAVDADKLQEQLIKNLEKAKNSFYGVNGGRYVIHEIFFKQDNDTLYYDEDDELTAIGEALFANIERSLKSNGDLFVPYTQHYDKSYLFLSIGEKTYYYELF